MVRQSGSEGEGWPPLTVEERCSIQRLSLGNESDPEYDDMVDEDALERGEKDQTTDWTNRMLEKRDKRVI